MPARRERPARLLCERMSRRLPTALAGPSFAPRETRGSNSLKDFLWHLNGIGRGNLLDLGPVWQSTVSFFIERGFKVSTEDVLMGWKQFSQEDAERQRSLPADAERVSRAELAKVFLETSLQYAPGSFDAVLAWDVLDYLEDDAMKLVAERSAFIGARRRSHSRDVPQQTSATISALSHSG